MNKIQKISFRTIQDFLASIPENELEIVEILRKIIFDCIPECKEKLSYNVPYYCRNARICFIWPASVPWGNIKNGVAIGFCRGTMLSSNQNYFDDGNNKIIRRKTFLHKKEIDILLLKSLLYEAACIDQKK